jgi:hypothetical protein
MQIESYDYINGQSLGPITLNALDFGDIIQNQHCTKPIVLRVVTDNTNITGAKLFLEDKGLWKNTEYGYLIAKDFTSSVEPGSNIFQGHFTEISNASYGSSGGVSIPWDGTYASYYVWLDANINDSSGMASANFRLFY